MNRELALIYQQIIAPWVAAGPGGVTITPITYYGTIPGSEYLIYDANKYYLLSKAIIFAPGTGLAAGGSGGVTIYDLVNAAIGGLRNYAAYYDSGAAQHVVSYLPFEYKNIHLSRIVAAGYSAMYLSGYRINRV